MRRSAQRRWARARTPSATSSKRSSSPRALCGVLSSTSEPGSLPELAGRADSASAHIRTGRSKLFEDQRLPHPAARATAKLGLVIWTSGRHRTGSRRDGACVRGVGRRRARRRSRHGGRSARAGSLLQWQGRRGDGAKRARPGDRGRARTPRRALTRLEHESRHAPLRAWPATGGHGADAPRARIGAHARSLRGCAACLQQPHELPRRG